MKMITTTPRLPLILFVTIWLASSLPSSSGFVIHQAMIVNDRTYRTVRVRVDESTNQNNGDKSDPSEEEEDGCPNNDDNNIIGGSNRDNSLPSASSSTFHTQLQSRHEQIRVEKARTALEVQHTQSFLKRRPVKLPYTQARKWVQANLGADTKEEYEDLVANGNLRTPYIPKQPEQYYTSTREWISWDHFLKGVFDDEQPSAIQPQTGIFD